ncbi:MAG: TIGR02300 family protein [Caulobacterales bacterium]
MAKAELGDKQNCPSCSAKFYDLRKRPAVCPKCGFSFDPGDETLKVRRSRTRVAAAQPDYEDEEDEEVPAKVVSDEDDEGVEEEESEVVELEEAAAEDPVDLVEEEDEDEPVVGRVKGGGDEIPEGFSEDDEDTIADEDDEGVPLLEDDEGFDEDELSVVEADEEEEGR